MPAMFQKHLDIYQGYNFRKDVETPVGFLTELKIGDVTLKGDQAYQDPMSPGTELATVVVLSGVMWELSVTDALYFSGQISGFNKQQIGQRVARDLSGVDVVCKFAIYEYDPLEKKYFKCLLPTDDVALDGVLEERGGELNVAVADDTSTEIESPENYAFQIGIKPRPRAQTITVATSFTVKIVKAWGLEVER